MSDTDAFNDEQPESVIGSKAYSLLPLQYVFVGYLGDAGLSSAYDGIRTGLSSVGSGITSFGGVVLPLEVSEALPAILPSLF